MAKNPTPAQLKALKDSKGVKPTAAFTKTGQKATGLAKSSTPNRFALTAKTPVKKATSGFAGSGTPLGASMGVNPLSKGQIARAASTSIGGGVASGSKIATRTVVSEATKRLQRGLSQKQKDINMKGMSRQQRIVEGERRSELTPDEYMENFSRGKVKDMKKNVSKSMKETSKKKIVVKKK